MTTTAFASNVTLHATERSDMNISWCAEVNDLHQDKTYEHFYQMAQMITGLVIYPLVCFPGVLGNTLTLFVLSRRNMLTSTNAFLSALAVSDSVKLINDILYFFVIVFMKTSSTLGNLSYGYLYPYAHFIFSLSACVSSWLTVSVALERYLMVCHPTRARAVWSRRRAVVLCASIYVIMTLLALPSALRYRTISCVDVDTNLTKLDVELTEMWQNQAFVRSYTWAQNLLRSIVPLIVLVVLNTCIIAALKRSHAKKRKNARHRVTVMMIVVILAFLICITPDAIMSTVFGLGYHEADYLPRGIREITDTLLAVNAGVNFLIYCAFNQVFRKSFLHMCCHKSRKANGWMTELEESTYRRCSDTKTFINNNSTQKQDTSPTQLTDNSFISFQNANNGRIPGSEPISNVAAGSECSAHPNQSSLPVGANIDNEEQRSDELLQPLVSFHLVESPASDKHLYHNAETAPYQSHQLFLDYELQRSSNPLHQGQSYPVANYPHHHRISTDGLKKSRNSIKCTRERHRSTAAPDGGGPWKERADFHDSKCPVSASRPSTHQNQTKVCACVHTDLHAAPPSDAGSDQKRLDNVGSCEGKLMYCPCNDHCGLLAPHTMDMRPVKNCVKFKLSEILEQDDKGGDEFCNLALRKHDPRVSFSDDIRHLDWSHDHQVITPSALFQPPLPSQERTWVRNIPDVCITVPEEVLTTDL